VDTDGVVHGQCLRAVWYRLNNYVSTNPPNARAQWIFAFGNMFEAQFIAQVKQMGLWVDDHVKWYNPDYHVSGELDLVIRHPEEADKLIGIECCTPETTFIAGDYRIRSFEDLNGKGVVGHTSAVNHIVNFQERWVENEKVYRPRGKFDGLTCEVTGEHPILTAKVKISRFLKDKVKNYKPRSYHVQSYDWKKAKDLQRGDYICIPKANFSYPKDEYIYSEIVKDWDYLEQDGQIHCLHHNGTSINGSSKPFPSRIPITEDLYWLMGLYLAEGSCSKSSVYFSLHEDEKEIYTRVQRISQELFGLEAKVWPLKNNHGINVRIGNKQLREFIKAIIPGNSNDRTKSLNYHLVKHKYLNAILDGAWQGDGYVSKKGGTQERVITAVPHLAYLYFQLAAHCGGHPGIKKHTQGGAFAPGNDIYFVNWSFNQTKGNIEKLIDDGTHWLYKVKDVNTREYTGLVYNMETSPDNSYVAGMISVHNCKTLYGYYATAEVMGTRTKPGFPKMSQLLQAFTYVDWFKETIGGFKMAYLARDSMARREFNIEFHEEETELAGQKEVLVYPVVDRQVFPKFTLNGIYDRFKLVWDHYEQKQMPGRDYKLYYTVEEMEERVRQGLVGKTKLAAFQRNKKALKNRKADWRCAYCNHLTTCWDFSQFSNEEAKVFSVEEEEISQAA
jgi:hypothetical protein